MGWEDKLKGWANDAADFVEETIDDAGDWIQDTVDGIAGEDSWASDLVERAGDLIDGDEGLANRAWNALDDYTEGTWAETAFDAADGFAENGATGALGAAQGLIGDYAEGTWAETAWDAAEGIASGGTAGVAGAAQGLVGDYVEDTWAESVWESAERGFGAGVQSAADAAVGYAGDYVEGTWAEDVASGAESLLVPDAPEVAQATGPLAQAPAADPAGDAPADMVMRAAVEPQTGGFVTYDAPATPEAAPVPVAEAAPIPEPATFEPPSMEPEAVEVDVVPSELAYVEPEPEYEATDFEVSVAAADQVEDSVDDMFADLG